MSKRDDNAQAGLQAARSYVRGVLDAIDGKDTPRQDSQHVLKAEPATADATDRESEPTEMLLVPRELIVNAESMIADEWGDDTEVGKALNDILHGRAAK